MSSHLLKINAYLMSCRVITRKQLSSHGRCLQHHFPWNLDGATWLFLLMKWMGCFWVKVIEFRGMILHFLTPTTLPSPSPSPISREHSCHWLERWCHAALPCLSRSVLVRLLVPSASITLPFFCGGGFTSVCPATFSQDSSGLCWLWVQLQSLV